METRSNSTKRMKMEKQEEARMKMEKQEIVLLVVFSEWFLSIFVNYLMIKEIARIDSAICNKSYRPIWLECIAKYFGLVPTLLVVTNDQPLRWCANKIFRFQSLKLFVLGDQGILSLASDGMTTLTTTGASTLTKCCIDLVELKLFIGVLGNKNGSQGHLVKDSMNNWVYDEFGLPCILKEFGKRCRKLKKFYMDSQNDCVTDNDIIPLISSNHHLEEIEIIYCFFLSDKFLITISKRCRSLRRIMFHGIGRFTDQGIIAVVSTNHGLEDIELHGCKLLTDASLAAMAEHCHQLKKIAITYDEGLPRITDAGFVALVSNNPDLEEVKLICPSLTDNSLNSMAVNCQKLRNISFIRMEQLTDQGIMALVLNNHDLEEIELRGCKLLTDASLTAMAEHCHQMKHLKIELPQVTDAGFVAMVSNNHDLEDIQLYSCNLLTDASLTAMSEHCHQLKKIAITYDEGLPRITDAGFVALVSNNPDLEEVKLICPSLTDNSLNSMAVNCQKLRKISFIRMEQLTDQGIMALVLNNHDLEEIELLGCKLLTDESFRAIGLNCRKLKIVFIDSMRYRITYDGIKFLLYKGNVLEGIHMYNYRSSVGIVISDIMLYCRKLKKLSLPKINYFDQVRIIRRFPGITLDFVV